MNVNRTYRAAAAACALLLLGGCSGGEEYTTIAPDYGPVERVVEDIGTVAYRDSYTIVPLVSGTVVECTFEEGDAVSEGQILYMIDSGDLEDQITQARLSLESAKAACAQAEAACDDLTVRAAASGMVTAVYVHEGDFVSTGTPVADLVDSANLTLTVPFASADAATLFPGTAASITFPNQAEAVTGTVTRVYDASSVLPGGREGVYVEFAFQNPGALMSGASAMASVGGVLCMEAGSICYATEQSIYATQSGQVLSLPIQAGSAVTAGQTVMTIDNASLTHAVTNAALSCNSAAVSLAQLEDKRSDYTVLAPADGVILTRSVKKGDLAAAATPMATLAQPGGLCVEVEIDELYIDQVWPGQQATVSFTSDSGEARLYQGTVRRIDDAGITSGGVTSYPVELALDDLESLRAGMNVSVSILADRRDHCLRIPSAALQDSTVQVLRDGRAVEVSVRAGLTGGGYTEILDGLTEQDQVILP